MLSKVCSLKFYFDGSVAVNLEPAGFNFYIAGITISVVIALPEFKGFPIGFLPA